MANDHVHIGTSHRFPFLSSLFVILAALLAAGVARADAQTFDLIGPRVDVTVTRGPKTLPISSVSQLQPGDRLWIHTDFPANQSVRYLLIVAFLQGPTNPPPEAWFTRVETWNKRVGEEGTVVTVPHGAQQALLFLAPSTGGGFSTLLTAVRSRPGVFVRASEDLNHASLDRTRADKYLEEVRETSNTDPDELHARTVQLAQTLRLKVNQDCFDKPLEQQASCLTQNTAQLVLDDGPTQSLVTQITSGPSSDLIGAVGGIPTPEAAYYSPYIGSVMDLARLLGNLHTAQFQYIPALTLPRKDRLDLRLNTPPSFSNPKSVLVVGLPSIAPARLPELRPSDPKQVLCLQKSPLILPAEGTPLVFSAAIAHDFTLQLKDKSGKDIELPAVPDAARGGFVVDTHTLKPADFGSNVAGTLRGFWGFQAYDGPAFQLRNPQPDKWVISPSDANALIVGRDDTIHLKAGCAACVKQVTVQDGKGTALKVTWKAAEADELEAQIPLQGESAGQVTVKVDQFGLARPDVVTLHTYAEAARLDRFAINAGDRVAILTGTRLDEVQSAEVGGVRFAPAKLSHVKQGDALDLMASNAADFHPGEAVVAHAALKDGRTLDLQATVEPPRPKVSLVSKSVQRGAVPFSVHLENGDELPQNGRLSFFLKSQVPSAFPPAERIEVATVDGSFDFSLSVADGNLVRQDSLSVLAVFDPTKDFGPSAFGPLQFRAVDENGSKGDWQPLATLVRIPALKDVHCPDDPQKQCTLSGSNLFLLDSVAADAQFKTVVPVPAGYVDGTLDVPRPTGTLLYIKLRDDPATIDSVSLPVLPADTQ